MDDLVASLVGMEAVAEDVRHTSPDEILVHGDQQSVSLRQKELSASFIQSTSWFR
jgi:hypothetical protein